jgi:hypothetical protein
MTDFFLLDRIKIVPNKCKIALRPINLVLTIPIRRGQKVKRVKQFISANIDSVNMKFGQNV